MTGLADNARIDPRPNILFIMADDFGFADASCYGRRDYATPSIDRLAAEGVRLTQAYANSAVCSATRCALMTGQYQYRLPVGLEEPIAGRDVGLPPDHPTLPGLLRAAGYATTLVGKWHLGLLPKYGPLQSGYERFFGCRTGVVDYFRHTSSGHKHDLWDQDELVYRHGYMTDLLGDRAVAAVGRHAAELRPFLLSLHFTAPHWPWEGPDDEAESQRLIGKPLHHFDGGTLATYARIVARMDMQIGRVLDALDANGLAENTIVVFTSDNGGERFSDTWPFTGKKSELLEGGLRIPALLRWPLRISPGVCEQVTATMDWLPTLLAAAGAAPDPGYPPDGIDLLALLAPGAVPVPRRLFWRFKAHAQRAVRDGDWKLLEIAGNSFLFDIAADPLERANLKERHRAVYDRLASAYAAWEATMLPLDPASFTLAFSGAQLADHFGVSAG